MPRVVSCRVLIKDKKEIYIAAGKKSCPITEAVYFLKYIRQFNLLFGSLSGVGRYCVCMCVLDVSRCSFCLSREWKGPSCDAMDRINCHQEKRGSRIRNFRAARRSSVLGRHCFCMVRYEKIFGEHFKDLR